jgi:queuine tRNA-ribosyltransferase
MHDSVMPTRAGRHGLAFSRYGRMNLKTARFAEDRRPIDSESSCPAARDYSRAYLHHLFKSSEILGMMLVSWANLAYYQELMAGMRAAIAARQFAEFTKEAISQWQRGESALL